MIRHFCFRTLLFELRTSSPGGTGWLRTCLPLAGRGKPFDRLRTCLPAAGTLPPSGCMGRVAGCASEWVGGGCWLAELGGRAWRFQRRRWDRMRASPAQLQKNIARWGLTRVEELGVASGCLGGGWEERRRAAGASRDQRSAVRGRSDGGTLNAERGILKANGADGAAPSKGAGGGRRNAFRVPLRGHGF